MKRVLVLTILITLVSCNIEYKTKYRDYEKNHRKENMIEYCRETRPKDSLIYVLTGNLNYEINLATK